MKMRRDGVQSAGPCVQKPVECPGMLGRAPETDSTYMDHAGIVEVRERLWLHRCAVPSTHLACWILVSHLY